MRSLVITIVVAFAAVARAEPEAPDPTSYLRGGLLGGGNSGHALIAPTLDSGMRVLHSVLWVHGQITDGLRSDFDAGNGRLLQLRAGIEARACMRDSLICAAIGEDGGVQQATWDGYALMHASTTRGIAVSRLTADVGSHHVRIGVDAELVATSAGVDGFDLGATLAYVFGKGL